MVIGYQFSIAKDGTWLSHNLDQNYVFQLEWNISRFVPGPATYLQKFSKQNSVFLLTSSSSQLCMQQRMSHAEVIIATLKRKTLKCLTYSGNMNTLWIWKTCGIMLCTSQTLKQDFQTIAAAFSEFFFWGLCINILHVMTPILMMQFSE